MTIESISLEGEEWRPLSGFRYLVSNMGRVCSVHRAPRILKCCLVSGYPHCTICESGEQHQVYVHSLVAAAFIGPKPSGMMVNHIDGVKTNNCLSNLEYVTPGDNNRHAYKTGLKAPSAAIGEAHPRSKLTVEQVSEIRKSYAAEKVGMAKLALRYGVTKVVVRNVLKGTSYRPSMDTFNGPIASRSGKGEGNAMAKLTRESVISVRSRLKNGEHYASVARDLGVSPRTIYDILKGATWTSVKS